MITEYALIENSPELIGEIELIGAKNAVLVIMASLLLTNGISTLYHVPASADVLAMIQLLEDLGAFITFDEATNVLIADTSNVKPGPINQEVMKKMRASVLVMGPLLARFGKAELSLPGGCVLGARPIDFHLKAFQRMNAQVSIAGCTLNATTQKLRGARIIFDYPSVGATENAMMAACLAQGTTTIINAALEPEVLDLMQVLIKMGAKISINPPATIEIVGVSILNPIEHTILIDRLEAGSLLLAAAITGGTLALPNAPAYTMDIFLAKLQEMGHHVITGTDGIGIWFTATKSPNAISFKTAPYPGFPTDLQAPMMVAQCLAAGTSEIQETVYENRLLHVRELQKMGAQISINNTTAIVHGVEQLYGANVIASDIRASCALVLAGLAAQGKTTMTGVHHLKRGYDKIDIKLKVMGAKIAIIQE